MLCYLWGWTDDPDCGMHSPTLSGQQPHWGSEGWRLSEPQAQSHPSLQPFWLPAYVGHTWLGTGKWYHLKGSSPSMHSPATRLRYVAHIANVTPGTFVFLSLQCSRSCGGGFQRRQVLCKQRLADGSILELPNKVVFFFLSFLFFCLKLTKAFCCLNLTKLQLLHSFKRVFKDATVARLTAC